MCEERSDGARAASSHREAFGLYLVLTNPRVGYEACTEAAVDQGLRYVQLRAKDAPFEDVLRIAKRLRAIARGSATRLIVNDDIDIAMAADADGIHVGQDDLPLLEAKRRWGHGKVYGLSTHDETQAELAWRLAPTYIGVGPVFPTPTKANPDPVLGLTRAAAIVRASPVTCVAIGGIDDRNLPDVLASGIDNFAVVRHVGQSEKPAERIRELMELWRLRRA